MANGGMAGRVDIHRAASSMSAAESTSEAEMEITRRKTRRRRRRSRRMTRPSTIACVILAGSLSTAAAQNCISLANSQECPAFSAASVSTDNYLTGLYPFLSGVTNTKSFDQGLRDYVSNGFAQLRYGQLIGCSSFNADNTTDFYARYSTSFLCNGMVQNSINPCGLTGDATRPLCAESCTEFASSEQEITASNICGNAGSNALKQIRADFTDCALPADSLTGSCINAVQNQPDNCGYTSNLSGLCGYCAASSPNNTDSCCVFSNASSRCNDVTLPIVASSALKPIVMTTTRSSSGSGSTSGAGSGAGLTSNAHRGLTGGQIAGIVVGSVLGALLLLGLIIGACLLFRRRSDRSPATSVFNQPSTSRQPQMAYNDGARDQERAGLAVMPGGRVARMAALEDSSSPEPGPKYAAGGAKYDDDNDSADMAYAAGIAPPPKRSGSLSSGSQLAAAGMMDTSPSTNAEDTSPDSHAQSEQLHFFKDYYSQDEIRPGDLVSTLWAYEPRAADEFHLERGDMIKVLGIWDDGWATGVRIHQKAEDWREDGKIQRDSGLSNGSSRPPDTADGGEVKAFPLVCVCLPQHWRRTIEGETTESSDMQRYPDMP